MSPFRASVPLTDKWEHFGFSVAEGVGTVTLDRPGKLNALTFEAYADLRDLLAELPHRGDTRVLQRGPPAAVEGPLTGHLSPASIRVLWGGCGVGTIVVPEGLRFVLRQGVRWADT